ncbi:unnamed protein product [Toxocara canis]|uniref:ArgoN domain-containing protein n=1 Tax=Toxocara canis TaxID=6265 RepID=A0A183V2T9_TOXCA|nr:unnamed protein product [Toxocara canis]
MSLSGATGSSGDGRGRGRAYSLSGSSKRSGTPSSVGGGEMSDITSGMSAMSLSTSGSTPAPMPDQPRYAGPTPSTRLEEVKELLKRPSVGTVGRRILLTANYYELSLSRRFTIHRYEISIKRPGKATRFNRDICRQVFWDAAKQYRDLFGKYANLVYDDAECLWTADKLSMKGATEHIEIKKDTRAGRVSCSVLREIVCLESILDFAVLFLILMNFLFSQILSTGLS